MPDPPEDEEGGDEPADEGEAAAKDLRAALDGDDDGELWSALEHCLNVWKGKDEGDEEESAGPPGKPAGILAILAKKRKAG
jgi:hypothetical protein